MSTPRQSDGRAPESRGPARIAPLATLPLFHKLGGRKVVLAGDGDGAVWKAELLAAAGSDLLVFAPERPEVFAALVESPPAGTVTVIPRGWEPADLSGARFAVADVETDAEAEVWGSRTRAMRVRRKMRRPMRRRRYGVERRIHK